MKNEEAHRFLEDLQRKYTRDRHLYKPEFIEANGLAILALEKQIPQKPKRSGKYGVCPSCSRLIERYEQKHGNIEIPHCKWCGKKLDWSDTE